MSLQRIQELECIREDIRQVSILINLHCQCRKLRPSLLGNYISLISSGH